MSVGALSDLIAKNVQRYHPDAVVTGSRVMRYLRDELSAIGKEGPEITVFGIQVFVNPIVPDHDIFFLSNGKPVGKITNIRRHEIGLS